MMFHIRNHTSHLLLLTPLMAVLTLLLACSTPEKYERRGHKAYAIGEYYEAAQQYHRAYTATPAKDKGTRGRRAFLLAESHRRSGNVARAVGAYQNAARYLYTDTTTFFRLGEALRMGGNYKGAAKSYQQYLDGNPTLFVHLAENGLKSCEAAPAIKARGSLYTVKQDRLFSSRRADFSPCLFGTDYDQIIFSSTRPAATGDEESGITGTMASDLFMSKKDEKGKWRQPEPLQGEVNTAFEEGAGCVTPDGSALFLTVCRTDPQYPRFAEICRSSRSDATWSAPKNCELSADTLSSYAHPAVSPDGKWLYFVSDMPGGYGGYDLWRARLDEGGYGAVENLGKEINTEGDEMFPTFRPNGDLYFSSNGRIGMGGLDIYRLINDTLRQTQRIEHLPYPVNSEGDDFGMTFDGLHNRGFFSSNRGGGRGWDKIYSFECPEVIQTLRGWVYEQDGYELTQAVVYMVGDDGTNLKLGVKLDGSFEQLVQPGVHYVLLATCEGYLNHSEEISIDSVRETTEHTLQFPLASITSPVLVRNVFYDFDKATLTPESVEALNKLAGLLKQNPNVTIELSAHCDYRGAETYNQRLSQRRAESVVHYLIAQGIQADRLKAVGYGEGEPKTVTKKMAETYPFLHVGDTLTERYILRLPAAQQDVCNALNRRTQFRVLRTTYGLFDGKGQLRKSELPKPEPQKEEEDKDAAKDEAANGESEDDIIVIEPRP